jgi:hypothetical protein
VRTGSTLRPRPGTTVTLCCCCCCCLVLLAGGQAGHEGWQHILLWTTTPACSGTITHQGHIHATARLQAQHQHSNKCTRAMMNVAGATMMNIMNTNMVDAVRLWQSRGRMQWCCLFHCTKLQCTGVCWCLTACCHYRQQGPCSTVSRPQ